MTFAEVIAPLPLWAFWAIVFALPNLLAFALFGIDKLRALRDLWRLSESALLAAAFFGGYIGAKAGQRVFRHKTRKQPFASNLNTLGLLQLVFILALLALVNHADLLSALNGLTAR